MTSDILLAEIQSPDDALDMSSCRNRVRLFMTHNQEPIEPDEQLEWYKNHYLPAREQQKMFGYVVRDNLESVGYGLITNREAKWWVSGGLVEKSRGKGLGFFLFQEMTLYIHETLNSNEAWLDVLQTNIRAQDLYRSIGYLTVQNTDEMKVMVHRIGAAE